MNPKFLSASLALTLFLFVFIAVGCKTTQSVSAVKQDEQATQDYYNKLGNNLERLQMLQSGIFVQYQERLEEKTYGPWAFNDNEDSMMLYTQPVGIPNKDGYWVYTHQFISNNADKPVYSAFIKLEATESRDSFKAVYYDALKPYTWEQVKAKTVFNNFNFSELKPNGEIVYFVKENNYTFSGVSMRYKNPAPTNKEIKYRQDYYHFTPEEMSFRIHLFVNEDDPDDKVMKVPVIEHLKRLNPQNNVFLK